MATRLHQKKVDINLAFTSMAASAPLLFCFMFHCPFTSSAPPERHEPLGKKAVSSRGQEKRWLSQSACHLFFVFFFVFVPLDYSRKREFLCCLSNTKGRGRQRLINVEIPGNGMSLGYDRGRSRG